MASPLYHNPFLKRACIDCPDPVCNCKANESCVLALRTCDQCDVITCIPKAGSSKGGGISGGAVAGAVVACVIAAALLFGGLWFLRRQRRMRKAQALVAHTKRATLSGRPTPTSVYAMENGSYGVGTPSSEKPGTPGLGPSSPRSPSHHTGTSHTLHVYTDSEINLDPFADSHSVRSGTSSHVIPIAYVPPSSASMSLADGHRQSSGLSLANGGASLPPSRPFRSPELNLKLEPPKSAASRLSTGASDLRPPRFSSPYAASQRSGVSRDSTISSVGSFVYGDTPVVVSQAQGGVRQVLGVARPEVIQVAAGGLSTPSTPGSGTGADLMRSWSTRSKKNTVPPVPELPSAPIEHSPFSPDSDTTGNPFADREDQTENPTGSVRSLNTFGQPAIPGSAGLTASMSPSQTPRTNTFLAEPVGYDSRPSSIGTVVESAQRVMLGGKASASTEDLGARMAPPPARPTSGASVADSILSDFPFVPPSPIGQGGELGQFRPGSLAMSISESVADPVTNSHSVPAAPVPTLSELARQEEEALASEFGQAARLPSRHTLGLSTFSSASGVSSSGLEAFPFHFGGAGHAARDSMDTNMDMSVDGGRVGPGHVRASLDTLALSRDLEAFPLPNDVYGKR
ncbi:hypothetical protein FRC06_006724 [Ceratobasidium sp. 370]|nr:hypothetical protein FRC06_006724 [Ceratobasidium sp. 370]